MFENMDEILKGLNLKEIIGYAIGSEKAAGNYYRMLVKVFDPNELVKTKFENIAKDEDMHKWVLLDFHKELFGDDDYTVPEGLPPFESVAEVDTVETLLEALNIAMQNERNAYNVYMFLAKHHKEHRKLFKYLAQTETGHYETLKQEKGFFDEEVKEDAGFKGLSVTQAYRSPMFKPPDLTR